MKLFPAICLVLVATALLGNWEVSPADPRSQGTKADRSRQEAPMECRVIITDQTANPIWGDFAEIELNNNTPHRIEIETNLASGLLTFVDVEVTDKDNRRVSKPFHSAMIASPRDRSSVVATLKPGERLRHKIGLFSSIDQADLKPGQYKVRVRFKYDKYDMKSEYVNVILTEKHLRETPEFGDLFSVP